MRGFAVILAFIGILVGAIVLFEWKNQRPHTIEKENAEILLAQVIDSLGLKVEDIHLDISKSTYMLKVMADTLVLKSYPMVLGGNPEDDKLRQGDQCTPEGTFHIKSKYPHEQWSKFLWIDYPTADSWRKHQAAKARGDIPSGAAIGGEIGIHGVPRGRDKLIDVGINWTLGCVSLKRADIDEIYPYVQVGTEVQINK